MSALDYTHDPQKKSFIPVDKNSDFSIQNLPFGVFSEDPHSEKHLCTRVGDTIIDLQALDQAGCFTYQDWGNKNLFKNNWLNPLMELGRTTAREIRNRLSDLCDSKHPASLINDSYAQYMAFYDASAVTMHLPVSIGDYTDFYSSKEHATNVGVMFRGKDNALQPNWLHLPVGYHGRASSVVVSGTDIHRPMGQTKADNAELPTFGPSHLLDFELEMGFFTCAGNLLGDRISVDQAEDTMFGLVLLNDWSARDIQKWEYVPLGPFLAKNFATSISPWVITMDALEPFRTMGPVQDPKPLDYLNHDGRAHAFDINLETWIDCDGLRTPQKLCRSNFKYMYWSMAQQLAHHTVTGCNMRTGDLLGSGTISGQTEDAYGSLLELTWRGSKSIRLENGDEMKFIRDGDTIIMKGWCENANFRIGFGEVSGKILPVK